MNFFEVKPNDADWLTCPETLNLLSPKYGKDARRVIAKRCADGMLQARADVLVFKNKGLTEPYDHGEYGLCHVPMEDWRKEFVLLPDSFWSPSHATATPTPSDDKDGFGREIWADWSIGDFGFKQEYFSGDGDKWEKQSASGVMFQRRQVMHLVGVVEAATASEPEVVRKGGRKSAQHGAVIAELTLQMAKIGADELKHYTASSLAMELKQMYAKHKETAPSLDNLERYAQGILRVLRKPD